MFEASFKFECDICGKKETRERKFGNKLRVDKDGRGSFNLSPFFSWRIAELCFDRRYEMIGPHKEDMLTFKYAVCGEDCFRKLDSILADVSENYWYKIKDSLKEKLPNSDG